jgi:hypothetical protein
MNHDGDCGIRCSFPGCHKECVLHDMCHNEVHACSEHSKAEFKPERRAIITIQLLHPRKFVKVEVPLSATIDYDNYLNLERAAEQLVRKAMF